MLVKLLATVAMAAATWLFWRLVNKVLEGAVKGRAPPQPRPPAPEPERVISMVQDPETGAWREDDR